MIRPSIILLAFACILCSCEKVIDLGLKTTEKRYVIEGMVTNRDSCKVLVSQTRDFTDNNDVATVSGAIVTIAENGGTPVLLAETAPGVYQAPLTGTSGNSYQLQVIAGGTSYTATSVMPPQVNLDTIFVTTEFLFTDFRKVINAVYADPPGRGNAYRFVQYLNGKKEKQILIQNDDYTDGNLVNSKLFIFSDDDDQDNVIDSGDEVMIDMQCIDQPTYKYWYSLFRSSTGDSNQAAPSNPVSNMQGGALGYFSAHTLQTRQLIAP